MAGNNSPTNLRILRLFTSLELFLSYKFYFRLPGLTDVYHNGETVPKERLFAFYELMSKLAKWLKDSQNSG